MVPILESKSEHVAHAWKKTGLIIWVQICECFDVEQMPWIDQIADFLVTI